MMAWFVLLWAAGVCTAVAVQLLQLLSSRYPTLGEMVSLQCDCVEGQCQPVFWCRMQGKGELQFLLSNNKVDKPAYGTKVSPHSYKGSVQVSGRTSYYLRIQKVEKADAGLYFCILPSKTTQYRLSPVTMLQPGETPPTLPTTTTAAKKKAKAPSSCPCSGKAETQPVKGCSFLVLWSLAGMLMGQALLLLATLLYFSRLPKKCHHQFGKK